jgi:hypothetical protein
MVISTRHSHGLYKKCHLTEHDIGTSLLTKTFPVGLHDGLQFTQSFLVTQSWPIGHVTLFEEKKVKYIVGIDSTFQYNLKHYYNSHLAAVYIDYFMCVSMCKVIGEMVINSLHLQGYLFLISHMAV